MKISEIPFPKVRELAKQQSVFDHDTRLKAAFIWGLSPEGDQFWRAVNRRDWDLAATLCPELFTEDKPVVAYSYEIAKFYHATTGEYTGWAQQVSFEKPPLGPGFRNLVELVAR